MILQALTRYYEDLLSRGEIAEATGLSKMSMSTRGPGNITPTSGAARPPRPAGPLPKSVSHFT